MWNFPCPHWHDNWCCHYIGFVQATILLRVRGCISKVGNGSTQVLRGGGEWKNWEALNVEGRRREREGGKGINTTRDVWKKNIWNHVVLSLPRITDNVYVYTHTQCLIFIQFFIYSFYKAGMPLSLESLWSIKGVRDYSHSHCNKYSSMMAHKIPAQSHPCSWIT